MNFKKISGKWYFLTAVVLIYVFLAIFKFEMFNSSFNFFINILKKVIPILAVVFVLMFLTNYFFTSKIISRYFQQKGILKWFFVIVGGILSTGAIYMWYPLLAELKSKGLSYGLIACFLYNRAIKLHLLPLMIFYFSLKYVVVLSMVMVLASVVQGLIINKIIVENENSNSVRGKRWGFGNYRFR